MAATKELKRTKVSVDEIQMGMYISKLDRPWEDSPFLLQGFVVSSSKVLSKLKEVCDFVYVDGSKSVDPRSKKRKSPEEGGQPAPQDRNCLLYTSDAADE